MALARLVIDTDGGIDDAVALWWALCRSGTELAAVLVTGGNVDRDAAGANVRRVLAAAGRPGVPVALGEDPARPETPVGIQPSPHGPDGLAGTAADWSTGGLRPVDEPAAALLGRLAAADPGQIALVTVGPLTTLAAAVHRDPTLPGRLGSLTVMGGVVDPNPPRAGADAPTVPETNAGRDAAAAASVAAAPWGPTPLQVGSDVTTSTPLHPEDLAVAGRSGTPPARFLAGPLHAYATAYGRSGRLPATAPAGSVPCHDLLAVMAALDRATVTRHRTARPPGGVTWHVAAAADGTRLRAGFRALVT